MNLAAGLDTRPYRLDLPAALQWVEIDQPGVIDFKTRHLAGQHPRCILERHAANLADPIERRALLERVCSLGRRVLVLTEGVVPYLSNDEVAALADDLRAQPNIVGWVAEYVSEQVMQYRAKRMGQATPNAPFQFRPAEWLAFFQAHGWKQARYLPVEGQRLGRPFPAPFLMRLMIKPTRWVGKRRLDNSFANSSGYVLYEPILPTA